MENAEILSIVSRTLKNIIHNRLGDEVPENQIVFSSPADSDQIPSPKLLIYLYHVTDNPYLKNEPPEIPYVPSSGQAGLQVNYEQPPVGVDLHYMFTPYADDPVDEIKLIGYLKQLFSYGYLLDSEHLKDSVLKGYLEQTDNSRLKIIPDDPSIDDIHKLWGSFHDQSYKLSLFYFVTPVRIPLGITETATPVTTISDGYYSDQPEDVH